MVRNATNASVSEIEVEVERPNDRARKRNEIGGSAHSVTASISGSGGSGTMITNNSAAPWYLELVTVSAAGAGDAVTVTVEVMDEGGSAVIPGTTNAANGVIPFDGVPILSGWTVDYTVTQSDESSYSVELHPVIRQPSPDGVSDSDTITTSLSIDSFEDSNLTEYSGTAGAFGFATSTTFAGSVSLEGTGAGNDSHIYSAAGLSNYPGNGDTFRVHVRSSNVGDWQSNHRQEILYGAPNESSYTGYVVRVNWHENDNVFLMEVENGIAQNIHAEGGVAGDLQADKWYTIEVDRSGIGSSVEVIDPEFGSVLASMSTTDQTYATGSGIGFRNLNLQSGESYYYDAVELVQ